jgi:CheY-like chemotaxis protein
MRILVAESQSSPQAFLSRMLEQQGHQVCRISSADELSELIDGEFAFDLAFLTIDPPELDGLAFLDRFVTEEGRPAIPVILCAELAQRDKLVQGLEQGATDCLVKPVDAGMLRTTIARACRAEGDAVLVVDDEEMVRNMLVRLLSHSGFKVLAAKDADEAIAMLQSRKVGLVLSDILMPSLTGLDLVMRIRSEYPDLPVVLMTGYTDRFDRDEAREAGANEFVTKPFRSKDILKTVQDLISSSNR